MHAYLGELLTAGAFVAIAVVAHHSHRILPKLTKEQSAKHSKIVVIIAPAVVPVVHFLGHPVVAESIKDYAIHFVIYSGYILGH